MLSGVLLTTSVSPWKTRRKDLRGRHHAARRRAAHLDDLLDEPHGGARSKRHRIRSPPAAFAAGRRALFFVAFIAVLREGIELALFLTASVFASDTLQATLGAILGLGTAILLGWSIFATTVRLDLRRFFQVTGFLLILFAAGLVAHGVHEFNEVGWIPPVIEHVWDVNAIVDENSTFGQLLAALFGYNPTPSLTEILAYAAYFVTVFFGLRLATSPPHRSQA